MKKTFLIKSSTLFLLMTSAIMMPQKMTFAKTVCQYNIKAALVREHCLPLADTAEPVNTIFPYEDLLIKI
jgi:hypothetical protein